MRRKIEMELGLLDLLGQVDGCLKKLDHIKQKHMLIKPNQLKAMNKQRKKIMAQQNMRNNPNSSAFEYTRLFS